MPFQKSLRLWEYLFIINYCMCNLDLNQMKNLIRPTLRKIKKILTRSMSEIRLLTGLLHILVLLRSSREGKARLIIFCN